jgi:hypothetical protein
VGIAGREPARIAGVGAVDEGLHQDAEVARAREDAEAEVERSSNVSAGTVTWGNAGGVPNRKRP